MEIKFSYMIKQEGRSPRMITGKLSENEIIDLIQEKYDMGDLPCPIHFNREDTVIKIDIDEVTI